MKYFFILLAFIILNSCCHNSTNIKHNFDKNNLTIEYRKTGCFGACPTFSMIMNGKGKMEFNGQANVSNIGLFNSEISDKELDELLNLFSKADFFNLKDKYTDNITDLPSTFITLNDGNKIKIIEDYYGAPKELKEIEKYLDALIEAKVWNKK